MERIVNLRTSIMMLVAREASSVEMKMVFHKGQPAFEIAVHVQPHGDHRRVELILEMNRLPDYRFINVAAKRSGITTHMVSAIVVAANRA